GIDRRLEMSPRLAKEVLPHRCFGRRCRRSHLGPRLHRPFHRSRVDGGALGGALRGLLFLRLLAPGLKAPLRLSLGIELEGDTIDLAACHQAGVCDLADVWPVELRQHCAARVGCDRRYRPWPRTKTKSVQCQCSFSSGIIGHGASPGWMVAKEWWQGWRSAR